MFECFIIIFTYELIHPHHDIGIIGISNNDWGGAGGILAFGY
jgi:hypothetical protein